jgi:hypothetical protein
MILTSSTESTTDLVKTVIRENVNAQNIASARAEACRIARQECTTSCLEQHHTQGAVLCEKLAAAENCEKRVANSHLRAACRSMTTLSRTEASDIGSLGYLRLSCHVQGNGAIMCRGQ